MFFTTTTPIIGCPSEDNHNPAGLSCRHRIARPSTVGGHHDTMIVAKNKVNNNDDVATPSVVLIQQGQDNHCWHGATTSAKTIDCSWRGTTAKCFSPTFDVAAKEACLPNCHDDELALQAPRLHGQKDTYNKHDGSRPLSSWLSLLQQDSPLYTDDEMQRKHFLQQELRRLEMQRQLRLSLKLLDQYHDLGRQARLLEDLTQQRMALKERASQFIPYGTMMPSRSDADLVKLNSRSFISAATFPTNVTTFKPSAPRIVPPSSTDDEESSLGASVDRSRATAEDPSVEDDSHQEDNKPPLEARESGTAIIPALIQQYSVRGSDMAPFPLKLHAVLANPRYHHVITWLPDGKSWRVIDAFLLERFVLSRYFCHTKYSSFMRQGKDKVEHFVVAGWHDASFRAGDPIFSHITCLPAAVNGWGFVRRSCRRGPDKGKSYFHDDFLRDDPERCLSMLRRRNVRKKNSSH